MTYISNQGNLARTPELREGDDGRVYTYADVIVNSRRKGDDGTFQDTGSVRYSLTVTGSAAENLVDLAQRCGNVAVTFAGSHTVADYTDKNGVNRTNHRVRVDTLGVSLTGQSVTVERHRGGEAS